MCVPSVIDFGGSWSGITIAIKVEEFVVGVKVNQVRKNKIITRWYWQDNQARYWWADEAGIWGYGPCGRKREYGLLVLASPALCCVLEFALRQSFLHLLPRFQRNGLRVCGLIWSLATGALWERYVLAVHWPPINDTLLLRPTRNRLDRTHNSFSRHMNGIQCEVEHTVPGADRI